MYCIWIRTKSSGNVLAKSFYQNVSDYKMFGVEIDQ